MPLLLIFHWPVEIKWQHLASVWKETSDTTLCIRGRELGISSGSIHGNHKFSIHYSPLVRSFPFTVTFPWWRAWVSEKRVIGQIFSKWQGWNSDPTVLVSSLLQLCQMLIYTWHWAGDASLPQCLPSCLLSITVPSSPSSLPYLHPFSLYASCVTCF